MDVIACVEIKELNPGLGTHELHVLCESQQSTLDHLDIGYVEEHKVKLIELALFHQFGRGSIELCELVVNENQTGDLCERHVRSGCHLLDQAAISGSEATVLHAADGAVQIFHGCSSLLFIYGVSLISI